MKRLLVIAGILLLVSWGSANASFVSGSTGSDGVFDLSTTPPTVPVGTVIDGSSAAVPLPAGGIFNFTTVNVPQGWTVTFIKNTANTPVYILATGDVTIAGTISVAGGSTTNTMTAGVGGPGGYDGGSGAPTGGVAGNGLGPGGGHAAVSSTYYRSGGGGYGTAGGSYDANSAEGGTIYGNQRIIPVLGGSGGGGSVGNASAYKGQTYGYGGGGGGGALLIAASGTLSLNGIINANGGDGYVALTGDTYSFSGGGSGGAVKLLASTIQGTGTVSANGGTAAYKIHGGMGYIRLEAITNNFAAATNPPYSFGTPGTVFVSNEPSLQIVSIAGVAVPSVTTGSYSQPDVILAGTTTSPVTVNISAANIPVGTTVDVSVTPQYGSISTVAAALSGTDASSTASADVDISSQYVNVITAQATFTVQQAMYYNGEKIAKVKVAATMGGKSKATYITESGKEITGKELAMAHISK